MSTEAMVIGTGILLAGFVIGLGLYMGLRAIGHGIERSQDAIADANHFRRKLEEREHSADVIWRNGKHRLKSVTGMLDILKFRAELNRDEDTPYKDFSVELSQVETELRVLYGFEKRKVKGASSE